MKSTVITRYEQEALTSNLGCANLWLYLSINMGYRVLDLGCGRGEATRQLAKMVGSNGRVIGLDLTPAMITLARQQTLLDNVEFVVGDIHYLPFAEGIFDVICSNCVINHSLDKKQVFTELFRVLKPGGYFLIGDVMSMEDLPDLVRKDPSKVAACWGGAIPRSQYLEVISGCGFSSLDIVNSRSYLKEGYEMESIILKGIKEWDKER